MVVISNISGGSNPYETEGGLVSAVEPSNAPNLVPIPLEFGLNPESVGAATTYKELLSDPNASGIEYLLMPPSLSGSDISGSGGADTLIGSTNGDTLQNTVDIPDYSYWPGGTETSDPAGVGNTDDPDSEANWLGSDLVGNQLTDINPASESSWVDNLLGVAKAVAPAALSYGVNKLFPGLTDVQRQMAGYQGGIPEYDALRERVPDTYDPDRRPGSSGQRYFTNTQFVPRGTLPAPMSVAELAALNASNPARQTRPVYTGMAAGGIAGLKAGRYLNGVSDGMADKIPARINGQQEARLSGGEFVIPADAVSHLGNGNSDAGAKTLYAMMDRVRKARTGTEEQGKEINARRMLPV